MGLIDKLFRRNKQSKTTAVYTNDPQPHDELLMMVSKARPSRPSPQRAHAKHRKSRTKMAKNSRKKNRR